MSRSPRRPHILLANAVRTWGGAERFVLDAAQGLQSRGWPVTVQVYPNSPLHRRCEQRSLATHAVRTRADGAPWNLAALAPWLRLARVDVILSCYEKDLRTVAWAARLARLPITVVHSRECDVPLKNRPHYRYFYRRVADHVLVNSEATRRTTLDSVPWLEPERLSVLYKGVDVDRIAEGAARTRGAHANRAKGPVVLGFLGQIVPRKRLDWLLRRLASPQLRRQPWTLRIAGQGEWRPTYERLARNLGLEARVEWCGFVDDVPGWLGSVQLLVLPSRVEGFGYAVAEAAAAGVSSLALRASSLPEVLGDGEAGVLVSPDDDAGFERALHELLSAPETLPLRGQRAERFVRRSFGLERMISRLEETIMRVHGEAGHMRRREQPA